MSAILEIDRRTEHMSVRDAFNSLREGEIEAYRQMVDPADAQEGPQAFAEGRKPKWEGR